MFTAADIISVYTRADAIEEGQMIDVSSTARKAGFTVPTAVTSAVWYECVHWDAEATSKTGVEHYQTIRLGQLLIAAREAAVAGRGESLVRFAFSCPSARLAGAEIISHTLYMEIGPGDAGEPVVTIMMPEDC